MISLRPVTSGDDAFLHRVYASTREAELAQVDWDDVQKDAFVRMQFHAQQRHYAEHCQGASFDVIVVDGQPAGRLYVARWPSEVRIVDITLLPGHRGHGIGTSLLKDLIAEAARDGKTLSIHVERFNRALVLYQRVGFVPVEDKGVYLLLERPPGLAVM